MTRLVLMSDVVLDCQRRADAEGDAALTTPEWKALISEQYAHLYAIVVKAGMRYWESTYSIPVNGAASYALPVDFDEYIGVDRTLDATAGRTTELGELMVQERNRFSGQTGDAVAFAIVGQNIVLYPRPSSGTYTLVYVPQAPSLRAYADTATFDVVTGDGEAFLIHGVAVKAKLKLKEDASADILERDRAEQRFAEDVQRRALINPRRRVIMRPVIDDALYGDDPYSDDPASWRWRWYP